MGPREWILDKREDLLKQQIDKGPPCLFTGAQIIHESFNPDGTMSALLRDHNNGVGMKWAQDGWQKQFGGKPVLLWTEEWQNGRMEEVQADFASFPTWEQGLEAHMFLLTFQAWSYAQALTYDADPALYAREIYRVWATDPNAANAVQDWMIRLYDLLGPEFARRPVEITVYGEPLAHGWLEGATAVAPVREMTMPGWRRVWNPATGVRPAQIDLTLDILTHE